MQALEDGCQELREQLLLRHGLTLHAHYLTRGPISVNLLAALRLAVGDEQYLRAVEQKACSPLQVRESTTAGYLCSGLLGQALDVAQSHRNHFRLGQVCCWSFPQELYSVCLASMDCSR